MIQSKDSRSRLNQNLGMWLPLVARRIGTQHKMQQDQIIYCMRHPQYRVLNYSFYNKGRDWSTLCQGLVRIPWWESRSEISKLIQKDPVWLQVSFSIQCYVLTTSLRHLFKVSINFPDILECVDAVVLALIPYLGTNWSYVDSLNGVAGFLGLIWSSQILLQTKEPGRNMGYLCTANITT